MLGLSKIDQILKLGKLLLIKQLLSIKRIEGSKSGDYYLPMMDIVGIWGRAKTAAILKQM